MCFYLLALQLFVALVEEQSFARAAARENIAASALSKRIADLESSLKVSLIQAELAKLIAIDGKAVLGIKRHQ
ncbi:helix-turn-helix domain-containing protein [Ferrovibrio xuzhouensis]|uniref:LysR family transcriptional regulator n=1 Tax=Ferrovibrio xuzhouensis TaxID=1576914 RepID=A0ABV7VMZ0_9PROT